MSQVEVPEEIEHLDFEPEKEDEFHHHKHPTIPGIRWCGDVSPNRKTYMEGNGRKKESITCPECLRLIQAFGLDWYWVTHRKHFNSNCTTRAGVVYHDCGA